MPQCAVATCRNSHRRTRGRRIRYHRFPQIPEVRSRWVRACGRVPLSNGDIPFNIQTARICSLHFTNDSYEKDMEHLVLGLPVRSRLRRGAVPTIGVPVNVQPVTKMLVEDAKRSLLKVAHAKMLKQGKAAGNNNAKGEGGKKAKNNHNNASANNNNVNGGAAGMGRHNGPTKQDVAKMTGIDVLLALGLQPTDNLNKMHAMESGVGVGGNNNGKKAADSAAGEDGEPTRHGDEEEESSLSSRKSPKVPQSQQNGAALPEETASAERGAAATGCPPLAAAATKRDKREPDEQPQALLSKSSKPQSEQSAATPTTHGRPGRPSGQRAAAVAAAAKQMQIQQDEQLHHHHHQMPPGRETRKRRSADAATAAGGGGGGGFSSNGNPMPKKICLDQREQFIHSLIGSEKYTYEQLAVKAEQLRAEVQDLDELARAKEIEWNEILSMRKLKEEAFLRIERRKQIMGFMEGNGPHVGESLMPPASLALLQQSYDHGGDAAAHHHAKDTKALLLPKEERIEGASRDPSPAVKRERASSKAHTTYRQMMAAAVAAGAAAAATAGKHHHHLQQQQQQQQQQQSLLGENGPKQLLDAQSPEHRQIGEGRQGAIVDVRSIIADYRLRHPETVPRRRGRRMRNSVNVGLGTGGAMVETVGNMDSRPSSTDSCKSNSNVNDPNNAMSFKDVLVQFAKLSQQQGEPIKTPQNYPDVTLHPVTTAPTTQNSAPQASGSLLHGILTKSQSPRPTTFSPTLARLLTAPERERSAPTITATPHQTATQHLLQAYQGANPVSISDFLSSSKARTEITITPVVNNPIHTHSNNLIHVDDEEESSIIEERDSRFSMGSRDNRDDRDSPPRCQGCHERAAQFVCAGCGNQWYCSRECQVAAWDDHSELCSGIGQD